MSSHVHDPTKVPALDQLMQAAVQGIGGQPRAGQVAMADAVDSAMHSRRHLLVQAGTGTGKSLAYLVPALRHALISGRPVVISTATLALQNQIARKDLPLLIDTLAPLLPRVPSFTVVKGRSNYVCKHKLAGGYPTTEDPGALFGSVRSEASGGANRAAERLGEQVRRLQQWAEQTDSGDRDSLTDAVSDRAWRQVSVTGAQCLGRQCPVVQECFAERNRDLAREVDLVVTNHALLAIDAFDHHGIIPEHDVVVVDEAHDLADRITSATTIELTAGAVRAAVRDLRALGQAVTALDDAGEELRAALLEAPDGRIRTQLPDRLGDALEQLRTEARLAHNAAHDPADTANAGARKAARAALQEIMVACERGLEPAADDVRYITHSETSSRVGFCVAPLSIAAAMRTEILAEHTVVLTSATLAPAGQFEPVAEAIGLRSADRCPVEREAGADDEDSFLGGEDRAFGLGDEDDPGLWSALDVGSPFDYPRQGILYTAAHLPQPGRMGDRPEMLAHLTELIDAAGGGALCLFSSRRAAEDAAMHVRARLDVPLMVQGEDSSANLIRAFREHPDSCLFGTLTLWQGVDVPGEACRLVCIDRIPFPRPDDPLFSARTEKVARNGGNGFMSVSAARAAALLAQGSGRLIRSRDDRGMVAVLDPRLATARYGNYLMAAMPPLWRTTDQHAALAALRRLAQQ